VAAGRQADVCPGSSDLPALAGALATMSRTPAPSSRIQPATVRWAGWVAPDLVDGRQLVHTDVSPKNFLIAGQAIAVVDWAAPVRGAGWIDTALMVVRLIRAGHTPAQAEQWAEQVPAWRQAPGRAVTAFADARARLSSVRASQSSAVHLREIADAAARWAASRS
jgi:Ser/Thr protein kinase RdoA (MazF antagonist)